MADDKSERGRPATFDPRTGETYGSGSGAGAGGNPAEDYDQDPMAGSGAAPPHELRTADGGKGRLK